MGHRADPHAADRRPRSQPLRARDRHGAAADQEPPHQGGLCAVLDPQHHCHQGRQASAAHNPALFMSRLSGAGSGLGWCRARAEITWLFDGLDLIEPGVTDIRCRHPEIPPARPCGHQPPCATHLYGGVGRKP